MPKSKILEWGGDLDANNKAIEFINLLNMIGQANTLTSQVPQYYEDKPGDEESLFEQELPENSFFHNMKARKTKRMRMNEEQAETGQLQMFVDYYMRNRDQILKSAKETDRRIESEQMGPIQTMVERDIHHDKNFPSIWQEPKKLKRKPWRR